MSPNVLEKVTFSRAWDPKIVCAVTLALVFLCGAATGAVAMNLGAHTRLHQPKFDSAAGKALYFERMQRDLNLTPAQLDQMRSTLNDFWQYYRTVLTDGKSRVEQILNEEQRKKFERMLQENQPR
jgi:hypothetical protein